MGTWAPWDYIIAYVGVSGLALVFMHIAHKRAMDKLTAVYERGATDQRAMIGALQSLVAILEQIVQRERQSK